MLRDLEALTPSLVVCAAFLIAIVMFLRRQLAPKRPGEQERSADFPDDARNVAADDTPEPSERRSVKHQADHGNRPRGLG